MQSPISPKTVASLLELLVRLRPQREEYVLQSAIRNALTLHGFQHEAEVKLGEAGRIDFEVFVELQRIGIEVKVHGADRSATERQVLRYLTCGRFNKVILLSSAPMDIRLGEIGELAGRFMAINLSHNSLL